MPLGRIPCLVLFALAMSSSAQAGKIEAVQDIVKKECGKVLASEEALRLVKELFLSCVPSTKVEIQGLCKVSCLRENAGVVVGQ